MEVEIYIPASQKTCQLENLPDSHRIYVSMCGGLLCGGAGGWPAGKTCLKWEPESGTFSTTPVNISHSGSGNLCWDLGDRGVLIIGVDGLPSFVHGNSTTDLVDADGMSSSFSFTLEHKTM